MEVLNRDLLMSAGVDQTLALEDVSDLTEDPLGEDEGGEVVVYLFCCDVVGKP